MVNVLSKVDAFITEMNQQNSLSYKKSVLRKWVGDDQIAKVLKYTYDPKLKYHVTVPILEKHYTEDLGESVQFDDLFQLLDALSELKVTGNKAISTVNDFCYRFEQWKWIIYRIINRNLEIRIGLPSIAECVPGLITETSVPLAFDIEKVKNVSFTKDKWYSSRKLDGVRCIIIVDESGNTISMSRNGKSFETLSKLEEACKDVCMSSTLPKGNWVFDGEVSITTPDQSDDFAGIMSQIRRKNHTIESPKFHVFDLYSYEYLIDQVGDETYEDRLNRLKSIEPYINTNHNNLLHVLEQTPVTSQEHYQQLLEISNANDWEGIMLRKAHSKYEGKRTRNLLKCKSWFDAEYTVDNIEVGPFRVIDSTTGLETTIETVTNLLITHKNNSVSIGTGLSLDERKCMYSDPSSIIGKVITVKFFEETQNQNGQYSLRFPSLKCIHGVSRTV